MEMELQQQQAMTPDPATMREIMRAVNSLSDAELPDRPTVAEVARWLRKSPNTVYFWARKRMIPCRKVGRSYLFDKAVLIEWARKEAA